MQDLLFRNAGKPTSNRTAPRHKGSYRFQLTELLVCAIQPPLLGMVSLFESVVRTRTGSQLVAGLGLAVLLVARSATMAASAEASSLEFGLLLRGFDSTLSSKASQLALRLGVGELLRQ
jgi:hypothetical protein